jgi:TrmH family RNA methyltransferase
MNSRKKFKKIHSPCYTLLMHSHKRIESPANPVIKRLLGLRDGKEPGNTWFVEGENAITAAAESRAKVREIFVTEKYMSIHEQTLNLFGDSKPEVTIISERVSKKLSDTISPQGIFATVLFRLTRPGEIKPLREEVIPVLDRVNDPGNLGTLIRTADAFGVKRMILLEGTCSPSNQKVIRSSAGSIFHLEIAIAGEKEYIEWARSNGVKVLITDSRAEKTVGDISVRGKVALVLGNEASGASPYLKNQADECFRVPIPGKAESLNVAITAAIVLYEVARKSVK